MSISEMNKDAFWSLIDQARAQPAPDQWLAEQLTALGPEQAREFSMIYGVYVNLSYQYGLYTAATVIDSRLEDSDRFVEFQRWLVGQGRDVYMAALKDPDSLADAPDYRDDRTGSLARVGRDVYEKLTGRDAGWDANAYEIEVLKAELGRAIDYGEGISYPYVAGEVLEYLPRLCAKYLPSEAQRQKYTRAALRVNTWNLENPAIKAARKIAKRGRKGRDER